MPVDHSKIKYVQIFPPIGVARLGDSGFDLDKGEPQGEIQWFLPSEIPGAEDLPNLKDNKFRDDKHRIKRQAVQFRVYAYDDAKVNLGEITSDEYTLSWKVHVANHKASYYQFAGRYRQQKGLRNPDVQSDSGPKPEERTNLIIDAKQQTIKKGDNDKDLTGTFQGSQAHSITVHLGRIHTDEQGHLIFIGGAGYSRCWNGQKETGKHESQPDIISEFDSINWFDDTCDGWVDVEISHSSGNKWNAYQKATVLSAPPKFAWGIESPTTLYDLIGNIYHEHGLWRVGDQTSFYEDIWPVLYGAYKLSWVNTDAYEGHGVGGKGNFFTMKDNLSKKSEESQPLRDHVFARLRQPDYQDSNEAYTKYMPRLSGDDGDAIEPGKRLPHVGVPIKRFAALTKLQYDHFKKWRDGNFDNKDAEWSKYKKFSDVPLDLQPKFLTRAALEHTVGEPLYPGIEMHWKAQEPEMYKLEKPLNAHDPPFRVNHDIYKPGLIGRGLSLPWQSDFDQCNTHWWPSGRPDDVINIKAVPQEKKSISEQDFFKDLVPERKKWTRGIRSTPDDIEDYFPGSTDMVRHWQKFGFVTKSSLTIGDSKMPVWLEGERLPVRHREAAHSYVSPFC